MKTLMGGVLAVLLNAVALIVTGFCFGGIDGAIGFLLCFGIFLLPAAFIGGCLVGLVSASLPDRVYR